MWYYNEEYLSHHGILGQKWGVRRFQNEDGTYTNAGKKRRQMSDDYKNYASKKGKSTSEMSNAELRAYNERARLENEYRKLNPSTIKKGLLYVGAISGAMITVNTLVNNSKPTIEAGKKYIPKAIAAVKHPKKVVEKVKTAAKAAKTMVKSL